MYQNTHSALSTAGSINKSSTIHNSLIANRNALRVADSTSAPTAIVYCEANFGAIDGKTANGLIRYSEKYAVLSVIDSEKAGLDSGMVLDNSAMVSRSIETSPTRWRIRSLCLTTSSLAWRPPVACCLSMSVV